MANYTAPPTCHLLDQLPLELREQIWSYTLAEPTVPNRRHLDTCAYNLSRVSAGEMPSAISASLQPKAVEQRLIQMPRIASVPKDIFAIDKCKKTCTKRRHLTRLLQVNRQVYEEARRVFWRENTITFLERGKVIACSPQAKKSIRRLELWELDQTAWAVEDVQGIWKALSEMPELRHLTLPPAAFDGGVPQDKLRSLRGLQTFCLQQAQMTPLVSEGVEFQAFLAVQRSWTMRRCRALECRNLNPRQPGFGDVEEEEERKKKKEKNDDDGVANGLCERCQSQESEIGEALKLWEVREGEEWQPKPWVKRAVEKLQEAMPTWSESEPFVLEVEWEEGSKEAVSVWGLKG